MDRARRNCNVTCVSLYLCCCFMSCEVMALTTMSKRSFQKGMQRLAQARCHGLDTYFALDLPHHFCVLILNHRGFREAHNIYHVDAA